MEFSPNQLKAINERNKNILVSAAAGAGKTAVLVERIIRRITDKDNPIDVDHFLIMTFTNAAADEMRDRILKRIEELRNANPDDTRLFRQSMLVHNAKITTIHGFCSDIIREHFGEAGVEPQFRVGDDVEMKLLMQDVAEKLLEEAYEEASEREDAGFFEVMDEISKGVHDDAVVELILKLYKFAEADPFPEKWLDKAVRVYDEEDPNRFVTSPLMLEHIEYTRYRLEGIRNNIDALLRYIYEHPEVAIYKDTITEDEEKLEELLRIDTYMGFNACASFELKNLPRFTTKDPEVSMHKDYVSNARKVYKAAVKECLASFELSPEGHIQQLGRCRGKVRVIAKLASDFAGRYEEEKRRLGVIDFSDMEHLALKIMWEHPQVANEYRERFEEIYVDEYQDSNLTQETLVELICRKKDGAKNRFMVGDVKQSIYRFRQARPDLFMEKFDTYTDDGSDLRICLNDNYRSDISVIESVNEVFSTIMSRRVGDIEYDEDAKLHFAATCYEKHDNPNYNKTELALLRHSAEVSDASLEGTYVATRIHEMIKNGMKIFDAKNSIYRGVKYSDIVILVRALKGWDAPIRQALEEAGIPAQVEVSTGFFGTIEIRTLLDYLSVIDNPLQDIPLANVLRSPIGGLNDEELALIKGNSREMLYTCLVNAIESDTTADGLRVKVRAFGDKLNSLRELASYKSVYELLRCIIDDDYAVHAYAMPGGSKRMMNLNMLLKKAEDFGRTSYKGLFNFLRYMEKIKKYEIDFGEAGESEGMSDAVRIMTIHKSKGLEFPICFVCGMNRKRNAMDETAPVLFSARDGIGVDITDIEKRFVYSSFMKKLIAKRLYRENLSEEMRVLYVAMTRAREKLIMTGSVRMKKEWEEIQDDSEHDSILLEKILSGKQNLEAWNSYLDMLCFMYNEIGAFNYIDAKFVRFEDVIMGATRVTAERDLDLSQFARIIEENVGMSDEEAAELARVDRYLRFTYPYDVSQARYRKVSVSELKKKAMEALYEKDSPADTKNMFEEDKPTVPNFIREEQEEISGGSFYGTAFHRMLELWDYCAYDDPTEDDVKAFMQNMLERGRIEQRQYEAVKPAEVLHFVKSELGERMKRAAAAGKLRREQPFVLGVTQENEELMMVQGIIDAYFEENGTIVIVDYKTDRVKEAAELADRYRTQLDYYAKALERLLELKVSEQIIYAARFKETVLL